MEREENKILKQFGRKDCFKIPEGYFEHLSEEVLSQLPEKTARTVVVKPVLKPSHRWLKAAMFIGVISLSSVLGVHYLSSASSNGTVNDNCPPNTAYSMIDEIADYTMMDNDGIYASLMDNN